MSCFPCFSSQRSKSLSLKEPPVARAIGPHDASSPHPAGHGNPNSSSEGNGTENNSKTFTFRELAAATKNFRQECLLGEGGFGRVYKGTLQATGQVVAVKQLDRNGMHGNKEFLVEVMMLSLLHHPNLVNLIGYCADGDQRLLVYEYLPFGSLDDHLLDLSDGKKPLDWPSRMKIASGAAQGLEYLHEKANPPVIYRDLKSSNILLDQDYNPRLSDFGLAKLGLDGGKMHVSPRVMGTYGYCAPEYERTGELTLKSDVYSFGVILLELLTGRRAVDTSRPTEEQNLVSWAQPYFRDPKRFPELADPNLNSRFPVKSLNQAVGVCAMCLQEEPAVRPLIGDVVAILSFLTMGNEEIPSPKAAPAPSQDHSDRKSASDDGSRRSDSEEEEDEDSDQEDEQSFESSDGDDDDDDEGQSETSADNNKREETNPEKPPEKVKKSVKWASRCRSKGGNSGNTSVISRSTSKNSDNDDKNAVPGQNLESKSSVKLHSNSIQDKGTSKGDFEPLGSKKLSQVGSSSANSKNSAKGDLEPVGSKKMSEVGSSSAKSNNSISSSSTESTEGSFMTQDSIPKSNGEVESSKSNSLKLKKVASRDGSSDSSSSESSDDDDDYESSRGGSIERSSSRSSSYVGSSKYQGFSPVSRRDSSRGSYYGESAASFDTRSNSSSSSSDSDSGPEEDAQNAGGHDQIRRCRTTNVTSKSKAKKGLSSKSTNYTGSEDIRSVNTSSWKSKDRDS